MKDLRIHVGELALQVRDYGGKGDAVILLHFGGANLMMWQGVVPYFQGDYRAIAVDLRGHGKSDKPPTGYHIDDMARDLAAAMEHLGIERAHLVGSSLGAEVGLSLAANHPEKAISLVCDGALYSEYGPYGVWQGSEAEFKAHVARTLQERRDAPQPAFDSVDALVDQSRQVYEQYGWWNERVEALKRYDACEIGEGKYAPAWRKPASLEYLTGYYGTRFEDYYRRVKCPVLMLSDEEDAQTEPARTAMIKLAALAGSVNSAPATNLAPAEIVVPPGWVHPFGWMLDPEGISKVVLDFLARVRS
jgi:pimeloyl-ACP methyl ester carboxylesterase